MVEEILIFVGGAFFGIFAFLGIGIWASGKGYIKLD
jgi:hypothetical protein